MLGNVAEGILQILTTVGVKSIYGVSGDAIFPLLDALARQQHIKYYGAAQESSAAFMAYGEAKITGGLSVCTATSGPGAVKLLNGLAEAYYERVPILAITGQVETKKIGTNAKQFFHQQALTRSFSSYSEIMLNPESVIPVLLPAIETATTQKTVVHLSIPKDIFSGPLKVNLDIPRPSASLVLPEDHKNKIPRASTLIKNFQRPLLIIGVNCRETAKSVYTLSQQMGAGVIVAQQVRGVIQEVKPGVIGGISDAYIPTLLNNCDGIIILGQCPYELDFLPQVPLVQIAQHPKDIYYNRVSYWISGEIEGIFRAIVHGGSPHILNDVWIAEIQREKENRQHLLQVDATLNQIPIHPARLMAAINRCIDSDAIISLDIGSFMYWFQKSFLGKDHTLLLSGYWRSMGSALSKALGAKIANSSRQVVALMGDGGTLMALGELSSMAMYNIPIVVIVVNNQGYQLEKQKMQKQNLIPLGYEIKAPNFTEVAEAWGIQSFRVDNPSELENTLYTALKSKCPTLIDVKTADIPLPFLL